MSKGAKPKPVELHVIQGTFNSKRHADAAENARAVSDGSKPVPPYKLSTEQKKLWEKFVKQLWWNTEAESELLMAYVNLVIDKHKHDSGKQTKHDWNPAMLAVFAKYGAELGIGYANKQKIPAKKKPETKESKHFK